MFWSKVIEKHFTLDRTWKEPTKFFLLHRRIKKVVRDFEANQSMGEKKKIR